jgi:hypothetical protein
MLGESNRYRVTRLWGDGEIGKIARVEQAESSGDGLAWKGLAG